MADSKISALPAATVPLAGTEVLPIVQSSTTKQVSVANLTAGRAISASSVTNAALTSGRVTYAGSSGVLQDSANLTFDGTSLTAGGQIFLANNNYVGFKNTGGSASCSIFQDTSNFLNLYNSGNTGTIFYANGAEQMRLTATSLLVGTTSGSFGGRVIVSNDGTATQTSLSCINTNGSGTMRQIDFFTGTNTSRIGSIESTTTLTSYNVTSDYRLKEDIAPMTGALAKIAQLKPVTYKWKINGSDGQGFIAHELAEVVPDCVSGEKDAVDAKGNPDYQGVDTSFLIATLTSAIQEQQALIESLSARLTALESN